MTVGGYFLDLRYEIRQIIEFHNVRTLVQCLFLIPASAHPAEAAIVVLPQRLVPALRQ